MNIKFFHLRIKQNLRYMSISTESACINALLKITDNFFQALPRPEKDACRLADPL